MSKQNTSGFSSERQIPADIEAERSLLGAILQDPEVMGSAVMTITDDDFFYLERHQLIWNALCNLNNSLTQIDLATISAELTKMDKLDIVGGREYIFDLMESVASAAYVPWLLEHLRSKAVLRKLIRTSSSIIEKSMDPSSDPDDVLQDAERGIFAIADNQTKNTVQSLDNFVTPLLERLNNRRDGLTGVPTGITELDELTNGLQKSDLIILAARPDMGKTSLAMTVAANAAIKYGKNVLFFSLEMDGVQFAQRLLCSQAQIDQSRLSKGRLNSDEIKKLCASVPPINQAPIFVDDSADLSIEDIMSKARQLKRKGRLDLLVIDNLQLMNADTKECRAVANGEIVRKLKQLAKELQIPIIALALLSSKDYDQYRDRPQLSDLREAGSIEIFADMVWFVERPFMQTYRDEDRYKATLIVAKNRNGSVKDIDMSFVPEFTTFYDAIDSQDEVDGDYQYDDGNGGEPSTDFGGY